MTRAEEIGEKMSSSSPIATIEKYTCAMCGGTFDKGWSDAEALAELAAKFQGFGPEECGLVCDQCYRDMGFG